jgi:hypothetical protein
MNQIKASTTVNQFDVKAKDGFNLERDAGPPPGSSLESNKLKQMLAGLKSKTD